MSLSRYQYLAAFSAAVALGLIVLGAYVRLSDAGLGCPDWPVCYGQLTWPQAAEEIDTANRAFPERPVEVDKAWKEQLHRLVAGGLGLLVLWLALIPCWQRRRRRWIVLTTAACAAIATVCYSLGWAAWAAVLSALAVLLPLIAALTWRDDGRARLAVGLLALIIVQATLGMWTVTWKLHPVVVTAHLLGGMLTLTLLWTLALGPSRSAVQTASTRAWLLLALAVVLGQITLGGWTSSNYAALACPDLPTCQGQWWPKTDFAQGFDLSHPVGIDYEGGVLGLPARTAIHLSHRIGAMVTAAYLLGVAVLLWFRRQRVAPLAIVTLLIAQLSIGIGLIAYGLPLLAAVAHNATAALLLLALVWAVRGGTARATLKAP